MKGDVVGLRIYGFKWYVGFLCVFLFNFIVWKDGIVYGVDGFMVLFKVVLVFEEWKWNGKLGVNFYGFFVMLKCFRKFSVGVKSVFKVCYMLE